MIVLDEFQFIARQEPEIAIRDELGAPEAGLYFFDRVGFSPRLHELAGERDDVHLVPVAALGQ